MIVQFSRLGTYGRFGNQLFQYAFARAYAEKHNAILEIPQNWVGKKIFKDIVGNPISKNIPEITEDMIPVSPGDVNLFGIYQQPESLAFLTIEKIRNWFQIKDEWTNLFPKQNDFYIAAHLRRGDYVNRYKNLFCIVLEHSYLRACDKFNLDKSKIIWISEENRIKSALINDRELDFLPDFLKLVNSDILLRSNSTFSWWAGAIGKSIVYSPVIKGKVGPNNVEFVEGNSEPILDPSYHRYLRYPFGSLFVKEK